MFSDTVAPLLLASTLLLSILPDWLEAPWYIFFADPHHIGPKNKATLLERLTYGVYKLTNKAHTKASFPWGLISQIATVIFFLLVLR
jgi:hypothetical protein